VIEDINTFHRAIDSALKQANDNKLVTFGKLFTFYSV
jgi:mannose-1-phosphate guanylyltransferase